MSFGAVSLFLGSIDGVQSVTATMRMGRFCGQRGSWTEDERA